MKTHYSLFRDDEKSAGPWTPSLVRSPRRLDRFPIRSSIDRFLPIPTCGGVHDRCEFRVFLPAVGCIVRRGLRSMANCKRCHRGRETAVDNSGGKLAEACPTHVQPPLVTTTMNCVRWGSPNPRKEARGHGFSPTGSKNIPESRTAGRSRQ